MRVRDFAVEFAGTRLTVRTSDPAVEKHLRESYEYMLAPDTIPDSERLDPHVLDLLVEQNLPSELLPFVDGEVYRRFIAIRPDLLWLHAGVVVKDEKALVIGGASGQGKSTLTTMLCEEGWDYLSDDLAPIDLDTGVVIPFPRSPRRRVFPERKVGPREIHALAREHASVGRIRRSPAAIGCFLFLEFEHGTSASLEPLRQGDAAVAIIASCMNFPDHRGGAVAHASRLGRSIRAFRLGYGSATEAVRAVGALL